MGPTWREPISPPFGSAQFCCVVGSRGPMSTDVAEGCPDPALAVLKSS
jgi:hypothetical protein